MSDSQVAVSTGYGRKMKILGLTLAGIGFLNFTAFFVFSMGAGGGPEDKLTANGKYFVSEHGRVTEVSERTYRLLKIQTWSLWVTHPLAMFGFLIYGSTTGWKNGFSPK